MPDHDPFTSFFIRFKQNVDAHIAGVFRSTLGIPSTISKSMYVDGRWPETSQSAEGPENNASPATAQPRRSSPAADSQSIWSSLPMEFLSEIEASAESMYQFAWMSFIIDSPYSPLMLRHLPQPVPRDLPEGADASLFGFEDAFEDLLCVTSGQGLLDIEDRLSTKREWRQSFPQGLPPTLWLHQLSRQGLWEGWEPRPGFLDRAVRERWRRWLGDQDDPFHHRKDCTAAGDAAQFENAPSRSGEAEIEEELYELVEHGKVIAKTLQAAVGSISKLGDLALGPHNPQPPRNTDFPGRLPRGYREDVTTEERSEPGGYVTVIKTRVVFDEEDRPVSRMTESTTTRTGGRVSTRDSRTDVKGGAED